MKKMILRVLLALLLLVLLAAAGFGVLYAGRLRTVNSIEKITDYSDYNLYRMDVRYDYSIDDVINYGITDNQSMIDAILKETLPLLPIHMKAPQFGCSAFATVQDRHIVMGRNYDFKRDTSAMLVYCTPKDGYKSVPCGCDDHCHAGPPACGAGAGRAGQYLGQPAGCEHGEKARLPDRTVHLSGRYEREGRVHRRADAGQ